LNGFYMQFPNGTIVKYPMMEVIPCPQFFQVKNG
jgi:hypothetical protein